MKTSGSFIYCELFHLFKDKLLQRKTKKITRFFSVLNNIKENKITIQQNELDEQNENNDFNKCNHLFVSET